MTELGTRDAFGPNSPSRQPVQHRRQKNPKSRCHLMIAHMAVSRAFSLFRSLGGFHGPPKCKMLRFLAEAVFLPRRCLLCARKLDDEIGRPAFCVECVDRTIERRSPCCPRCGAFTAAAAISEGRCPYCREFRLHFDACRALGRYQTLSKLVVQMKRQENELLAKNLAFLWQIQFSGWVAGHQIDTVIAVPMHWQRFFFRAVNSASAIAAEIARCLGLPQIGRSLRRVRNTPPQENLSPFARFRNVRNAFTFPKGNPFRNRRILVIDDVLTTGATASELARVLKAGGASFVAVGVIARAQGHDR